MHRWSTESDFLWKAAVQYYFLWVLFNRSWAADTIIVPLAVQECPQKIPPESGPAVGNLSPFKSHFNFYDILHGPCWIIYVSHPTSNAMDGAAGLPFTSTRNLSRLCVLFSWQSAWCTPSMISPWWCCVHPDLDPDRHTAGRDHLERVSLLVYVIFFHRSKK